MGEWQDMQKQPDTKLRDLLKRLACGEPDLAGAVPGVRVLKLLYTSILKFRATGCAKMVIYFSNNVALQATNDLALAFPLACSFADVGERWFMASHTNDSNAVERGIGLSVPTTIQPKAVGLAT